MSDPLDLLTIDEAREAVNVNTTDEDAKLARFITAASRRIDAMCGSVVKRTVTNEAHDGGNRFLIVDHPPIFSVASVTIVEWQSTTSHTLTVDTPSTSSPTADMYVVNLKAGVLRRRAWGQPARYYTGESNVLISYDSGRFTDTTTVDGLFKEAASLFLQHLWRPAAGGWARTLEPFTENAPTEDVGVPGFGVPRAVLELLAEELLAPAVA